MNYRFISFVAAIVAAAFLISCSKDGITTSDASSLINGPNSIKGKISGKRLDNTAYSFDYDFHVTINDQDSYNEGYTDSETGDTLIYVEQYFFFDRNGYDDYGDNSSASGQYMFLEFELKKSVKNGKTTLAVNNSSSNRMYGMWQNILSDGSRFVYGQLYYYGYQSYQVQPTYTLTDLAYDSNSQILSGKVSLVMADGHGVQNNSGNQNATTITGDFKLYMPKENFMVTKANGNGGNLYRKSH